MVNYKCHERLLRQFASSGRAMAGYILVYSQQDYCKRSLVVEEVKKVVVILKLEVIAFE